MKIKTFTPELIDKSLYLIAGILTGIQADNVLHDLEKKELALWIEKNEHLLSRHPYTELKTGIESISNGPVDFEDLEELKKLAFNLDSGGYYYTSVEVMTQELLGLCQGLLADGELKDSEITALSDWLHENEELNGYYPFDELFNLVWEILEDGKITEEERKELTLHLNKNAKILNPEVQEKINNDLKDANNRTLFTLNPEVNFDNKCFVFTGDSGIRDRVDWWEIIQNLGSRYTQKPSKNTDYLVIGSKSSRFWKFESFGRKIEKAIEMRQAGHEILIIDERDLNDIIEDLEN